MPVASLLTTAFRFLDREDINSRKTTQCLSTEHLYRIGAQLRVSKVTSDSSRIGNIIRIIENFNAEPLLPGNGLILFNRTSRFFDLGAAVSPVLAKETLEKERPVLARLARVRPADHGQVRLAPLADFNHQIETTEDLIAWWHTIGRNFCNGIF